MKTISWDYCPECGADETSYSNRQPNGFMHYQCANCHQEYFEDIDYSDVVMGNLTRKCQQLTALQAENKRIHDLHLERTKLTTQALNERDKLQAEKERLAGALKFYANKINWMGHTENSEVDTVLVAGQLWDLNGWAVAEDALNPKQIKDNALLRKCIDEHWKPMREGTHKEGEAPYGEFCALCDEYQEEDCSGCPIKEMTGKGNCSGTPYSEAINAWHDFEDGDLIDRSILEAAFDKEIEFLESLIVEEQSQ